MADAGFREFVEVRYGELLRTAYLLMGTHHGAEDLLQSSLLKLMDRWDRVDEPMGYLYRIMANQRISLWRRIGSREYLAEVMPHASTPDSADSIVQRDELLSALAKLPARTRAVLVLRYWLDLSEAETAAILDCSAGSVKSQASRGLARLRHILRPTERLSAKEVLA